MLNLNLLPENRKEGFRLQRKVARWRGAMVMVVLGSILSVVGVGAMDWLLTNQSHKSATSLATWQALSAKRESGQVKAITERLNASIEAINTLFPPLAKQPSAIALLLSTLPENITLTTAVFNPDGSFSISGVAATRASFLSLRTALESSPAISSVSTSSVANQRENLPFEYAGQLKLQL